MPSQRNVSPKSSAAARFIARMPAPWVSSSVPSTSKRTSGFVAAAIRGISYQLSGEAIYPVAAVAPGRTTGGIDGSFGRNRTPHALRTEKWKAVPCHDLVYEARRRALDRLDERRPELG